MPIPTYLFYLIAAGTVAVLITILYGLNRALADAHWPAADRTKTLSIAALILLGWIAIAITLSALGTYHVTSGDRPTIQYGSVLPILIGALIIWGWEPAKRVLHAVPQQWLVGSLRSRSYAARPVQLQVTAELPTLEHKLLGVRPKSAILATRARLVICGASPEVMPTYQYRCEKCGKRFERAETISEHEAVKPQYPKCGSKKVTFVPGHVFVVTSKKS